ncbi:MAG: CYTH domain-containing protein [Erysipelotrichales bacterium]|nr:MAG: CYTH domain-containing protein [Erysipelotrichales bacterium]
MMRINNEIEYKTLVSEDQFNRLLAHFTISKTIHQTNTYFDTADRKLKAMRIACRIRVSDVMIEATVKESTDEGILEYNQTLETFDPDVFKTKEFRNLFKRLHMTEPLFEIGNASTTRFIVEEEQGELCFDRTVFQNHTDFELEYEVKVDAQLGYARFMHILELEDIPYVASKSKMIRATT